MFNFCDVCTYRSELIVTLIFKNYTNKIHSPSQKMLSMLLPDNCWRLHLEFCYWVETRVDEIPFWLYFRQFVAMMNPWFIIGSYFWQKNMSAFLNALENFSKDFFWAVLCWKVIIFGTHFAHTFLWHVLWWRS
jgi:hypothetical protein